MLELQNLVYAETAAVLQSRRDKPRITRVYVELPPGAPPIWGWICVSSDGRCSAASDPAKAYRQWKTSKPRDILLKNRARRHLIAQLLAERLARARRP